MDEDFHEWKYYAEIGARESLEATLEVDEKAV